MTSPAASCRPPIAILWWFSVILKQQFLDNQWTDFDSVGTLRKRDLCTSRSLEQAIRELCSLTSKIGSKWGYLVVSRNTEPYQLVGFLVRLFFYQRDAEELLFCELYSFTDCCSFVSLAVEFKVNHTVVDCYDVWNRSISKI